MSFDTPVLLGLLPLLALLVIARALRRRPRPALAIAQLDAAAAARGSSWRLRARWLPAALRVLAVALLIVAIARPQRGLAITFVPEEGIDIVLALDTSGSMNQRTAGVGGQSRLAAATSVIEEFIESLEGNRVGLVTFRSNSLLMAPLTVDHVAVQRTVQSLDTDVMPDGTAIGLGLAEALNLLRDSPARSQVVVLLTDGANNAGEVAPLEAARIAEALGIRVYTIGFHSADRTGSGVDVRVLQQISSTTDASYYDAATREELSAAYEAIGSLERSIVGERRFTEFEEFAPWLAAAAIALLLADGVLRATALRRYP